MIPLSTIQVEPWPAIRPHLWAELLPATSGHRRLPWGRGRGRFKRNGKQAEEMGRWDSPASELLDFPLGQFSQYLGRFTSHRNDLAICELLPMFGTGGWTQLAVSSYFFWASMHVHYLFLASPGSSSFPTASSPRTPHQPSVIIWVSQ